MNALVLSTSLHYLALIPDTNLRYRLTLGISTSLSVVWHIYGEPDGLLFYLDYLFAFLWLLQDLRLSKGSFEYISANALIFIININILYDKDYIVNHSLWHCLSALKCIYLADHINRTNNTPSRHLEQC